MPVTAEDPGSAVEGSAEPLSLWLPWTHQSRRAIATASARVVRARLLGAVIVGLRRSDQGLRASLGLGAAVLPQGVDRRSGQLGVGEDPLDALAVVEAVVVQHGEHAWQALDDLTVEDERGRDLLTCPRRRHRCRQLVLADHGADLVDAGAQRSCRGCPVEPLRHQRAEVDLVVVLIHGNHSSTRHGPSKIGATPRLSDTPRAVLP
ncbi:hypothetical protein NOCA2120021 [metagenome]|uniref:Uncharacterized protein n=1 Tax=metagenome TaxID=256318 RepID=A0A2P2BW65_9ZZZZ